MSTEIANYSPFVKTKRGEARALKELDGRIKRAIIPMFDVLALNRGVVAEADVEKHLEKQVRMINLAWLEQGPCYVDLFDVHPNARAMNGVHPLEFVGALLGKSRIPFIPVAGLGRDVNYLVALRSLIANGSSAIAVRLEVEDLLLPVGLDSKIQKLLGQIGAEQLTLHILIDCRSLVGQDADKLKNVIMAALPALRLLKPSRLVLSSSSMVADANGFKRNSVNRIRRDDLSLWLGVCHAGFTDVCFGDYGVIHPDYVDLDPRVIKPSAKIRYTTSSEWIFVKGFQWVKDTSQHHGLSVELSQCREFRGADSWGGDYIESAAAGRAKYGTLETWVTVDQNAHITLTSRQVERILFAARQTTISSPKVAAE